MCKQSSSPNSSFSVQWVTVDAASDGQRIDNFLLKYCKGVPKSHLYKALRSGQVRVNKGRINAQYRLQVGDVLRIPPLRMAQKDQAIPAPKAEFPIVFEDDAIVVIDKPAGVAVHGGSGVSFGVIEQMRAARPQAKFLELAHRLDKETSGLLIIAKKRSALVKLHDMFRQGKGEKHYYALVCGDWQNQRQHIKLPLTKYLTPHGERRVRVDKSEGKFAHTIIECIQRFGDYSLVDAELRTGRTHQIRVHLAASGFAIAGDEKYGSDEVRAKLQQAGFKRMFLHAHHLIIEHPLTAQLLNLKAPLPPMCQALLQSLQSRGVPSSKS
ncbi:RluA family pseudouridine synthase [Brackiella oedipodis]|uniref:RluA family pseudouridine synthase n=1 Tax=Brackiella oedipodis TaxID=124225 RepID=UPI000491FEE7|nr:RluA family pseudouridine synthase [Brackiella oedipodis]